MKTEVKIYREQETESLILDETAEQKYNSLMSELGISKPKTDSIKPPMYIPINENICRTLAVLCPNKTRWKEYNKSTIPLEVLEVIDYCEKNKIFDKMWILSDTKDPDPILIGETYMSEDDRIKDYSWRMNRFLIARWGDCAYELPELIRMGRERLKSQINAAFAGILGLKTTFDLMPDAIIDKCLDENKNIVTGNHFNTF